MSRDTNTPTYDNLLRHYSAYGLDRTKNFKGVGVEKNYRTYKQARDDALITVARASLTVDNYVSLLYAVWAPDNGKWVEAAVTDYGDEHGQVSGWVDEVMENYDL